MAKPKKDDRIVAILAHLGIFVLPIVLPLVLWVVQKDRPDSKWVSGHSRQALIFQVILTVGGVILGFAGGILTLVTLGLGIFVFLPMMLLYGLAGAAVAVYAAWKAYQGEEYSYPLLGKI